MSERASDIAGPLRLGLYTVFSHGLTIQGVFVECFYYSGVNPHFNERKNNSYSANRDDEDASKSRLVIDLIFTKVLN